MSYYTTYNKEGEKVTIMDTDEGFLSLAYRELVELPRECIARLEHVQHLDLSNNKLSDLHSLFGMSGLTSLVLDSNEVTSHSVFPSIPNLQILWLNKNNISNLSMFMENVGVLFPRLRQLSMMNNPAAPSYFNGGSKQDYLDYRLYVVSQLPRLEFLDDTRVTRAEREKALKVYSRRRVATTTSTINRQKESSNTQVRNRSASSTVAKGGNEHRKLSMKNS